MSRRLEGRNLEGRNLEGRNPEGLNPEACAPTANGSLCFCPQVMRKFANAPILGTTENRATRCGGTPNEISSPHPLRRLSQQAPGDGVRPDPRGTLYDSIDASTHGAGWGVEKSSLLRERLEGERVLSGEQHAASGSG